MNKRISLLLTLIISFICMNKVSASYNGASGSTFSGLSKNCSTKNCLYDNNNRLILQTRLYYIDHGSFTQIGNTVYYVDSNTYELLKGTDLYVLKLESFDSLLNNADKYEEAKKKVPVGDVNEKGKALFKMITGMDNYEDILRKESYPYGGATKGYRLVYEPAFIVINPTFGTNKYGMITSRGKVIEELSGRSPKMTISSEEYKLRNRSADVGIPGRTEEQCKAALGIQYADLQYGCGYRMMDVDIYSNKNCYNKTLSSSGNTTCVNTDENNVSKYSESYTKTSTCNANNRTNSIYGAQKSSNGTCKLYCKEEALVSLPGNISNPQLRGSYFAWPSFGENTKYTMTIKSYMNCKILDEGGSAMTIASNISLACPTDSVSYNDTTCRSKTNKKSLECPSGYTSYDSTTCRKNTETSKICPSGYPTSVNTTVCRNNTEKSKTCPNGYPTSVNATTCRNNSRTFKQCTTSGKVNIDGNVCARINNNPVTKTVATDLTKVTNTCPDGYTPTGQGGNNACVKDVIEWKCDPGFTEYPGSEWEWLCRKEECGYVGGGSSTVWGKYYTLQNHFCSTGNVYYGGYTWYSTGSFTSCTGPIYGVNYNQGCCSMSRTKSSSGTWTCWTTEHIGYRDYHTKDYKPYKSAYCKNGNDMSTNCRCPSGYKYYEKDGDGNKANICVKNENCTWYYAKNAVNHSDGKVALAGKCWYDGDQKYNKCPSGTVEVDTKYCYSAANKVCPAGTVDVSGKCYQYSNKICDKNKTVEINGKCYEKTNKICASGYVRVGNECFKLVSKTLNYSCPTGYTITNNKLTCYKTCNLDNLSSSIEQMLKNNKMEAKLTAGDNKKIDEKLVVYSNTIEKKSDTSYVRTAKFKIAENKNRYFNRVTGEVSDSGVSSSTIFDRGQGVVSLNRYNDILEGNYTKNYSLKISNIKPGTSDDLEVKDYTCNFTITENNPPCVCPFGTLNAGKKITDIESSFGITLEKNLKCAGLIRKYCNYIPDNISCKDTSTGENVDITTCVKKEVDNNKTPVDAYEACRQKESRCTNNTCINVNTGEKVDIQQCLEDGNSRKVCEEKKCCTNTNSCSGKCTSNTKKINGMIYKTTKCDGSCNNGNYCNFEAYCLNTMNTSRRTMSCLEERLGVNNIVQALNNNEISISLVEGALSICKPVICEPGPIALFRVIDLSHPFPGISGADRKPGFNWDNEDLIKEKITNARDVEGIKLYQKEPLMTITLTPSDVKKIRDYNKNKSYSDFNLKCSNNIANCVSKFLHTKETIDLNIKYNSSCNLSVTSSKELFDKCYNSNN